MFAVAEYWSAECVALAIAFWYLFNIFDSIKAIKPYLRAFAGLVSLGFPEKFNQRIDSVVQLSFFDVPLHHNFHEASKAGPKYDLRTIFHNSVVEARPGDAVTFVDNHE